jgi:hypothetical protein
MESLRLDGSICGFPTRPNEEIQVDVVVEENCGGGKSGRDFTARTHQATGRQQTCLVVVADMRTTRMYQDVSGCMRLVSIVLRPEESRLPASDYSGELYQ